MRTSILNGFLLGLTHAQDGSDEISNFKIESCNAADKERLSIELLEFKQGRLSGCCYQQQNLTSDNVNR